MGTWARCRARGFARDQVGLQQHASRWRHYQSKGQSCQSTLKTLSTHLAAARRPIQSSASNLTTQGMHVKALWRIFPCLSTPTIKRAKRFMKAARAGQSLTPYVTWSKYMRLRVGIKSSELSRLLTATATASGSPGKRVLRGRVGKRQVNSQYDQHVEKDGPVAFAQCSLNGSGAAVGATDAAISRQQILSRSAAIPMTPFSYRLRNKNQRLCRIPSL